MQRQPSLEQIDAALAWLNLEASDAQCDLLVEGSQGDNESIPIYVARILGAALRAAQKDSERLDWLDAEHTRDGRQRPVAALVLKRGFIRDSADWVNTPGTARAAIDSATQAEKAPATQKARSTMTSES